MSRIAEMPPAVKRLRARVLLVALLAGSCLALPAAAESAAPAVPPPGKAHGVVSAPAAKGAKGAKPAAPAAAPVVSPYARAAGEHGRARKPSPGHGQTTVQSVGKPHKPHAGASSN
jgi:hypothetical protein